MSDFNRTNYISTLQVVLETESFSKACAWGQCVRIYRTHQKSLHIVCAFLILSCNEVASVNIDKSLYPRRYQYINMLVRACT